MEIKNNMVVLEDSVAFSPYSDYIIYTDVRDTKVIIPMRLLVRLCEGAKWRHEKFGGDWTVFCDNLITKGD